MLQRLFYSISIISILLVLGSCGQNKKDSKNLSPINPRVEELDNIPDSAMLVKLESMTDSSLTVLTLEGSKRKTYSFSEAQSTGQIKGSLNIGDTLSVFPENKTGKLLIAINLNQLGGRWFYDHQQHRGMTLEKSGQMSSINADQISFRAWKLLNGKLYIYYVDMQQAADERHQYLVEEAEIRHLDSESLEFSFIGREFSCKRQVETVKFHS